MKLAQLFSATKNLAGQHAPEIYVGLGIGLFVFTTVLSAKGSKDVIRYTLIEEEEKEELTTKDKIKIYVKSYWPAAVTGAGAIFLIVSGYHIQYKRTAAATAACLIAQDSLKSFTDHVIDEIGQKRVTGIKDTIAKEKILANPVDESEIIQTCMGDTLCYDALAGRYFRSSVEAIRKAESEMNKRMLKSNFISLNEFYIELDLDPIKFGDELGWDVALEGTVDIELSSQLARNQEPCLVIDSDFCPRWRLYA